nr:calcium-binding protein [Solirubrobacter soli]
MLNRLSLVAAAVALAMPATAAAATVSSDGTGAITLRDAGAETNAVTVALDAQTWVISDSASPLTAGAGCTQSTANEVRCAQTAARATAFLGGGDDTFTAAPAGGWMVFGEAGSDHLDGGAGPDAFFGGAGVDTLTGGGGNDRLDGGAGDDAIDGGTGEDLTTYSSATGPVTVDLNAGTGGQAGEHDVLTGIEDATASGTLTGDDGPNFLTGGGADDVITGNGGDDTLVGEAGSDTLTGGAGDDRVYGDSTFGGAGGADHLDGGPGDDRLDGGDKADQIDGGPGFDILDYSDRVLGVDVDLRRAAPQGEPGEGDSAVGIEGGYGGAGNDTLVGDDGANVLRGGAGDDTLRGLGGADTLDGGAGANVLDCVASDDTVIAGAQDSVIACDTGTAPPPGGGGQGVPPGGGPNATQRPSVKPQSTRLTVRVLAKTLRLGRDGKLALRVNASSAGKLTLALKRGTVTYLHTSVAVKRGTSTLHLKLSASMTRKLRKQAKQTLELSLGTLRVKVVVKRA